MIPLPPAEALAVAGMAFVALFGVWKMQVEPRLARHRRSSPAG